MKYFLLFIATYFLAVFNTAAQTPKSDSSSFVTLINSYNYIDSLTSNNTLYIYFSSIGCFHHLSRKLKIIKQNKSYKLTLYPEKGYVLFEGKKLAAKKEGTREIILNSKQLNRLRLFEQEAKIYNCETNCGCTTKDTYEFILNHSIKKYNDSGCSWTGFNKLIKDLFEISR
jgi:hypothetical protein